MQWSMIHNSITEFPKSPWHPVYRMKMYAELTRNEVLEVEDKKPLR